MRIGRQGAGWVGCGKMKPGPSGKMGGYGGLEKKELKTERGSVFYWIEKNAAPRAKCIVFTHGLTANHSMFE